MLATRLRSRVRPRLIALAAVLLGAASSATPVAQAADPYTYAGPIVVSMSGATCRSVTRNQEEPDVSREITSGVGTASNMVGTRTMMCPINRRNTTVYGTVNVSQLDRVLMTSLRVSVNDGTSADVLWCQAFVGTRTGSSYWSSTRWACGSSGGCTSAVPASAVVTSELLWTNPFGSTAIVNQGAVSVGYTCVLPKNSNVLWARAAFSPNT